jgi:hypothetical protein
MAKRADEFYDAYWFVNNHPAFTDGVFDQARFDLTVVKVEPVSGRVQDDKTKNTQVEVWLETGPFEDGEYMHDPDLDCGGETFEKAMITLAEKVLNKYGTYEFNNLVTEAIAQMKVDGLIT